MPEEWQWYPGNDAYQQTHLDNRLGFAGYVWDPWLKVYHVRHRVYDPFDTRWLQADPIGYAGGDTDLRRYCNGDPVNFVDPLGLWGTQDMEPIGPAGPITLNLIQDLGLPLGGDYDGPASWDQLAPGILASGAVEIGALIFEPVDWAVTGYEIVTEGPEWGHAAALLPFIPGSLSTKIADAAGDAVKAVKGWIDDIIKKSPDAPSGAGKSPDGGKPAGGAEGGTSCGGGGGTLTNSDLKASAIGEFNQTGLSNAARAWDKHAGREGSTLQKANGGVDAKNANASEFVDSVLNDPARTVEKYTHPNHGDIIDIRKPDGTGLRYKEDGSFVGIIDPSNKK